MTAEQVQAEDEAYKERVAVNAWIKDAVGSSEDEVKAAIIESGRIWRVTQRDGKAMIVTRDYRPDRIGLQIVDGIVVGMSVG